MPALIVLRNLAYATPEGRALFQNLDLAFGAERTGVVGRNGVGKSTLLRLISGEMPPSAGAVQREARLGILRQELRCDPSETVAGRLGIADGLARIARLSAGTGSPEDAAAADWTLEDRLHATLAEVGLPALPPGRPVATLSGGQRTRLALAALLLARPDMLLLDEPTNNLDRDGRQAVATLLAGWRGGAIVASHDRALLRGMDRIVELSVRGAGIPAATCYGGGWDQYRARKAEQRAAAERELAETERATRALARTAQTIRERQARRMAAGRREQARGGIPRIAIGKRQNAGERTAARNEQQADRQRTAARDAAASAKAQVERLAGLRASLSPCGLPANRTVLAFERVSGGPPGGPELFRALSFTITGPERIAVEGANGAGKSTLMRLATGALRPTAGAIRRTPRLALLDQEVALLDPRRSIAENFQRLNPRDESNACRAVLARFLFRGDTALRPAGELSGGERLRAGLACVLGGRQPPELLILDEPTNHLDLDAIAAVEDGLRGYDGALLIASHDEDFLTALGITRRIAL